MKKIFAILAAAAALVIAGLAASSCAPYESGMVMYHIDEGDYQDMYDIVAYRIDKGFEEAGLQKMEVGVHYWTLTGEKNACNQKASAAFQKVCQIIDNDRSQVLGARSLDGVTIKLIYTFQGDHELTSYTFKTQGK